MTDSTFSLGDRVVDTDARAEDREQAVVVELPEVPAKECYIGALDATVADVNQQYPPTAPVVTVAYLGDLDTWMPEWRQTDHDVLADEIALVDEVTLYTYPEPRLDPVP